MNEEKKNNNEEKEKIVILKEGAKKDKKKGFVISIAPDEIPAGVKKEDIIAGYIVKNNEKEEEEKEKKSLKPKLLLLGAVILPLFIGLGSCDRVEHVNTPFEVTYYETVSPQAHTWGMIGQEGQEAMTNNVIEEGTTLEGSYYSADDHATKEDESINGHNEFSQANSLIDEYMSILQDENSTPKEIEQALRNIHSLSIDMQNMYVEKEDLMDKSSQNFEENVQVNLDERTTGEIEVATEIRNEYDKDFGLSAENVKVIEQLVNKLDAGEEIKIDEVKQDLAGNYSISGESCKEVVKESIFSKIKNSVSKFFNGIGNEQTHEIENEK